MNNTNPAETFTPFLPSTFNSPEDEDTFKRWIGEKLTLFSDVINDKTIGVFTDTVSSLNGLKASYDTTSKTRTGYNYLARIASYPANGVLVLAVPPMMNPQFAVFQVWGSASKVPTTPGTGDYFSYMAKGDTRISFTFTDQAITVTTNALGAGYSGFICIVYVADGT